MLSYSNFGSVNDKISCRVREAVKILHKDNPDLIVDGDIQANIALNKDVRDSLFPFSKLNGKDVNVLVFPTLSSGNIGYKLMQTLGRAEIIGPIVLGMNKPVHIVPINCSVKEIIDIAVIAAVDAQSKK